MARVLGQSAGPHRHAAHGDHPAERRPRRHRRTLLHGRLRPQVTLALSPFSFTSCRRLSLSLSLSLCVSRTLAAEVPACRPTSALFRSCSRLVVSFTTAASDQFLWLPTHARTHAHKNARARASHSPSGPTCGLNFLGAFFTYKRPAASFFR
jgi:hypothetical protein